MEGKQSSIILGGFVYIGTPLTEIDIELFEMRKEMAKYLKELGI